MANLTIVLFRTAAALFAFAALVPVLRDDPLNVTLLVLGIAFLILSLALRPTKQDPATPASPPSSDHDRPGTT
ncbi:MAG: hypothetical protein WEF86_17020 [Gemmatimonadota bacterium]